MRIALVVRPLVDERLRLAAQVGVTDIVTHYPGPGREALERVRDRVASFGLRLSVIEDGIALDQVVLGGPDRDAQIETFGTLLENMGRAGIPICSYTFMPNGDWNRTRLDVAERGGALVTRFDVAEVDRSLTLDAMGGSTASWTAEIPPISVEAMWENLEYLLDRVLPVAEGAGVQLAMHPDDPPMSPLRGYNQIMSTPEDFERLMALRPSPANRILFCQGSFASMGVDVPSTIRRFAGDFDYVHFRDVRGAVPRFQETFHDNGPTDMAEAVRTYLEVGFDGLVRPDHVPVLEGETTEFVGYTFLGRLHAVGYIQGLIHAARSGTQLEVPSASTPLGERGPDV